MTRAALPFVLAKEAAKTELSPETIDAERARVASLFWAGKHAGSNAKAACVERIAAVWRDPTRVKQILEALRPEEQAVLGVVKRFGGSISGSLLLREMVSRGLLAAEDPTETVRSHLRRLDADPVLGLCARLILVQQPGYYSYNSFSPFREYPNVSLPGPLAPFVEPAASLTWKPSTPAKGLPETTTARTVAEMLVDLEQTARALGGTGGWKTNQGGGLPATLRKRLEKLRPSGASDPLEPPDRAALDYSLLGALGAVKCERGEAWLDRERVDGHFRRPPQAQASDWVRAWLSLRLWQDGIGAVPERHSDANPTRIDPARLRQGRQMLAWALTRVAHNHDEDWLDLETFLLDLHSASGDRGLSFYWDRYSWRPHFPRSAHGEQLEAGSERARAFWLKREGVWAANALLSTLVHLGVVERGRSGGPRSERWCFRLTDVGKAVFGAPEVGFERAAGSEKCLTVQPNHEVLLYLDSADGEAVTTLGRIASRRSAAGLVQGFELTRASVYGALEAGMTPAAIEAFLRSNSRSGVPANVSQSLAEWSRKRDALVVRREVAVQFLPDGRAPRSQASGAQLSLASPRAANKAAKELAVGTESGTPSRDWTVDEHGVVSPRGPMSLVGKARLRRFSRLTGGRWRICAESVRAARGLGITADQILGWLEAHAAGEVPPILALAIGNWSAGHRKAFLGSVVLLQVVDAVAFEALRRSERLRPFVEGTLSLDTLVVRKEGRKEAAEILRELGFSLDAECRVGRSVVASRVG